MRSSGQWQVELHFGMVAKDSGRLENTYASRSFATHDLRARLHLMRGPGNLFLNLKAGSGRLHSGS
jgi:hypothetical protein